MTATTKAVVFTQDVKSGTTITSQMVEEINVPKDTPGDFIKSSSSAVGERLVSNVSSGQLIYPNDLMASLEIIGGEQNENYVTTSISVPDDQALGGLLTAGDVVDIAVQPDDIAKLTSLLPGFSFNSNVDGGIYYILSNVTLLDTTTSVASEQGSNLAATIEGSTTTSAGSTYIISLSYNDYKKLRIANQCGKVYLNLSPKQNSEKAPLLEQMVGEVSGGLSDAVSGELVQNSKVEQWNKTNQEKQAKAQSLQPTSTQQNQNQEQNQNNNNENNEQQNQNNEQ